jgi:hypothetical protein
MIFVCLIILEICPKNKSSQNQKKYVLQRGITLYIFLNDASKESYVKALTGFQSPFAQTGCKLNFAKEINAMF